MPLNVDPDKCTACGLCIEACPLNAITLPEDVAVIDHECCDLDGICIPVCPTAAISFSD